jgi:hypothetical protein
MMEPPNYLDGAKVIKWTWSGPEPFGIIEILDSDEKEEFFGLAICKYDDSDNFYRFSCDKNWEVVQDPFYKSIEEAIAFLPEQYKNVERNWLTK